MKADDAALKMKLYSSEDSHPGLSIAMLLILTLFPMATCNLSGLLVVAKQSSPNLERNAYLLLFLLKYFHYRCCLNSELSSSHPTPHIPVKLMISCITL